jgi:hypothetical protein
MGPKRLAARVRAAQAQQRGGRSGRKSKHGKGGARRRTT